MSDQPPGLPSESEPPSTPEASTPEASTPEASASEASAPEPKKGKGCLVAILITAGLGLILGVIAAVAAVAYFLVRAETEMADAIEAEAISAQASAELSTVRFTIPEDLDPSDPVVSAMVDQVQVAVKVAQGGPGTVVEAAWIIVETEDGSTRDIETVRTSIETDTPATLNFDFLPTDSVVAPGLWKVSIFVGENLKAERTFRIVLPLEEITAQAEAGDAESQFVLGLAWGGNVIGYPGERNPETAVKWFRTAADEGHVSAQRYLAEYLWAGVGVEESRAEAVTWYGRAAEQGDTDSQRILGILYRDGVEVEQDLDRAVALLSSASDEGDIAATTRLGELYLNYGNEEAQATGVELIRTAEGAGFVEAQLVLGQMHEQGIGVEQDLQKALGYYRLAAASGSTEAAASAQRIEEQVSPAESREAAKKALFDSIADDVKKKVEEAEAEKAKAQEAEQGE